MLRTLQYVARVDGRRAASTQPFLGKYTDRRLAEEGAGGRSSVAGVKVAIFGATGFLGKHLCHQLGMDLDDEAKPSLFMLVVRSILVCRLLGFRNSCTPNICLFQARTEPLPTLETVGMNPSTERSSLCLILVILDLSSIAPKTLIPCGRLSPTRTLLST